MNNASTWPHWTLVLAALSLTGGGCLALRSTSVPIPSLPLLHSTSHERLLLLLPGRGGAARDFLDAGFPSIAVAAGMESEMLAVDAHFGYYARRTILDRLHEDLVLPARQRGVSSIWLVGASLGGAGAILYAEAHPEEVQGLVLLAPFLGGPEIRQEIRDAGSLAAWEPGPPRSDDDFERRIWSWLRRYAVEGSPSIPLLLGFGEQDDLAAAAELLAVHLPDEQVVRLPGGHDWKTWGAIWAALAPRIDPLAEAQPPNR